MKRKMVFTVILLCLISCGGGGGSSASNSDIQEEIVFDEPYSEQVGDTFTRSTNLHVSFSKGDPLTLYNESVSTFSVVNEIPLKYGYSNAIAGPYLLETVMGGGSVSRLEYSTLGGETIIDDFIMYFTNIEYVTQSGSETPENIRVGDNYSSYSNARIFDAEGEDVGYEIMEIDFSVLNEEKITTPAGEFNAIKLSHTIESTRSAHGTSNYSGYGYSWYDTNKGLLLKVTNDGDQIFSDNSVITSATSELQSYSLVQSRPTRVPGARLENRNKGILPINLKSVFNNLKMDLYNSQHLFVEPHTN